jgi:hypothetical protein
MTRCPSTSSTKTTLKNVLRDSGHHPRVHAVEVDGDKVILVYKTKGEYEGQQYRAGPKLMALRAALKWDRIEGISDSEIDLLPWEGDDDQ